MMETALRDSYLELLKKILLNEVYFEHESSFYVSGPQGEEARWIARQTGREIPEFALTMVGRRRLDNIHRCVTVALEDGIPGDLMECGVWRGGVAILMRAILHAYGITDRTVWLADSFQGVPAPKTDLYPADSGQVLHERKDLVVSLGEVRKNFARFDLLDQQVSFIKGFFADSLPHAQVGPLAVLRLDGDLYESTHLCLLHLYDKVSPGGFVVIDDYHCYDGCRLAVRDFARDRRLNFAIQDIDGWGVYWRKEETPSTRIGRPPKPPQSKSQTTLPLFDSAYYLRRYADVAAAKVDPFQHYLKTGALERRSPHPLFDTAYYLDRYPDVAANGVNPLVHYWETGAAEGRDPHPLFDTAYYREQARLSATGGNPLLHFCTAGFQMGLNPHPLFDVDLYLKQCPEVAARGENPLLDFLARFGPTTPHPHILFDARYYSEMSPDVGAANINPLLHYLLYGWRENRNPHLLFDTGFYRAQLENPDSGICPLLHYVREGAQLGLKPHPWFDGAFYLCEHPEVARSGESALAHYLRIGHQLKFNPAAFFDSRAYVEKYGDRIPPGMSPLQHAVEHGNYEELLRLIQETRAASPNSSCTVSAVGIPDAEIPPETSMAKLIAFYLPQYHPIEENNRAWGKGFTDWHNVARATPLFTGHHQPRIPADLGFYDLRLPEVLEQQAELAGHYGIHGFCFYYYWFDGHKLLERPLEQMLERNSPRLPFCICWVNENWTRNWDGGNREILLEQHYSEGFAERFINDALPALTAPSYIRIGGAPLLLVYRPDLIPDIRRVTETWRVLFHQQTGLDLHLTMREDSRVQDPRSWGFDSMMEFSPLLRSTSLNPDSIPGLRPDFQGRIEDYRNIMRRALLRRPVDWPFYRCVMSGWDNTARQGALGRILLEQSPELYETWLRSAVTLSLDERTKQEPLVFLFAWNEWAEGAYLEPDRQYGHAYLAATRNALHLAGRHELIASQDHGEYTNSSGAPTQLKNRLSAL